MGSLYRRTVGRRAANTGLISLSRLDRELQTRTSSGAGLDSPMCNKTALKRKAGDKDQDTILFAADRNCLKQVHQYTKQIFQALNNQYRHWAAVLAESDFKFSKILGNASKISRRVLRLPEPIMAKDDPFGKSI